MQVRKAAGLGVLGIDGDVKVDFGAVMERMRRLRAKISDNDSARRFALDLGVDVYQACTFSLTDCSRPHKFLMINTDANAACML